MTDLLPWAPPSGLEMLVAWLTPLGACGVKKPNTSTLPYRMVTRVAGADDKITDTGTYSVHTFAATMAAAEAAAWETHRRILTLGPPFAPQRRVTISGSRQVFADRVETDQSPFWLDYGVETIQRFVARYIIDIRFTAA